MKILLIEDNPAEQEFMRELIRRFQRDGLDLVIEDRLGKALPHFTNDGISAILLDLNLPDSRGLDTFTTAQRLASHIPIIILTGIEDDGLALRAVEGGAQDYLVKSQITAPVLEKAIQYAIERHRILRELKKAGSRLLRDEETLKEREQTLQTLLNAPMDTIALLDRKGTILEINQPGAVRFGRKREDLIGTSIYDLMPPDVARTRRQKHDLVFETGRPEHFGDERDGRYYASHVFPVFGPAGTGVHHLAIFASDITDLKKTEADLNASENLYKTVFEATGAATAIIDGNGTIIRANCETEALFGYSPAELQGKVHWSKFVPQDELPRLAEFWRLLHEDPAQSNQHYEAKLVDRYGRIKYGILSVRLIPRSENCVVSITDVTESRRADQAISESEERFRGLFDHMSSGVAVYQPIDGGKDFVFQDFNTAAEKIEGVNKKTLIGRRVTEAFPRVRQLGLLDAMQKVWETGTPEYLPPALYEDGGRPGSWRENWVYKLPNGELVAVYNDVTDRRAAEEALRKSEEKFRTVIENVPDLIMVHRDGIIRYINNAAIYTMDVPASSMLDRSIFDFIAPENHGQVRDAMKKRMAGEWIAPYEIEILTGSGRRTAIISGSQIEFEGGPATLNVLTDVTERRRAEREVLNLKQQIEFILGATKTGLDIIDSDFNIVYIDPEWARVYGSPAGRKCHEYFMDRDSVCPECGVVKAFETKRPVVTEERLLKENNRPIQVTTIPFQDEKGEWFVAEVNADITELKQAEEQLRLTQFSVDTASDAVMWLRPDGSFFYVNDAACRMLGYPRERLLGLKATDINKKHPEKDWSAYWDELRAKGSLTFENLLRSADGREIPVEITANYLESRGKSFNCSFIRDLTERKKAEAALRESEAILNQTGHIARIGGWVHDLVTGKATWTRGLMEIDELESGPPPGPADHLDQYPEPYRTVLKTAYDRAVAKGESFDLELQVYTARKTLIWGRVIGQPVMENGRCVRLTGTFQDITERKKAEAALRVSEEKFRDIFNNTNDAIEIQEFREDGSPGRNLEVNEVACRMLGHTREEMLSMSPLDYRTGFTSRSLPEIFADLDSRGNTVFETEHRRKDGTTVPVEVSAHVINLQGRKVILSVVRDITERREAEKEIAHLASFPELNPNPILELTPAGEVTYQNPSMKAVLEKNGLGNDPRIFLPADFESILPQILEGDIQREIEVAGRFYLTVLSLTPRVNTIRIYTRDITDRRRMEEALKESQERLAEAMGMANLVHWEADVLAQTFIFNDRFYALYGTTAEREGGYQMPVEVYAREFCHPDDMHLVADEVRKSIEATDPGYTSQIEHRIIRRDGEIRNIVVRIAITKDEQGRTVKTHGVNQDITERKRAEEALRESEAQLNAVVQGSPVPQFGIDRDHRIIYWNRALEELTGIPGKDVIGTSGQWRPFYPTERWVLADYLVEGEPEKIREAYGGTCRPSGLIDGAFEAIDFFPTLHTEGGWLYYTAAPIRDANGAVIGAVETLEDITERKQAENALRESEERYKGVIESQTEFITRFTPDARVTFANDAYLRYFGLERAEIIGKKFHPRIPAEDREEVREHFASLTRESPVGTVEHRIIMPDGQVKWQKWVDRAIFGADGELVEYQSVGRDITGQKEAEEALRLSESRYREFFTTSRDVVFITTPAGEWVDFNDAAVELFGYNSRDELKSTPIARLYEDAEKRKAFIDLIIGKGYVKEYPVKLRKRDGTLIDTLITAVPLKGENGSITSLVGSIRDITERKKVEEALQESEEKYRNLVELASTGIAIIQDGSIAYANKGLGEVWGGSPEELLQKPISHLVHPKEREKILDRYRRRIAGETMPSVYETVFLRKDGSAYPAEIHAGLIMYRGRPADLVLIQDITERKRFVRALQESQERYRQIVEGTNAGVWVFDNDFTTIYANEQMARMLGVLPGEMLGRSISDFVFPDDRAQVNEVFAKIGNGRIPDTELRFRRKDQRESWLRVAAGPFFDVEGQRVGFTGIFSDITTSRKAEAAVRQAEAKYHSIVEFAVEGIYQIDTKGRFLTANPAMARVLGYESVEEMLASVTDTANQLWVNPAQRRGYLTKLREEELVNGFEAEYFRKDGGRIWVSLSTRAVKGPDGKIAYSEGTLEDITQRKRAEDALRESEEMFRNPVEQSPVGIFLIQDGIVRYVNPMLAEMGGFSRDDIMARPFADFVHPEDQAKVGEAIARLLRHEAHSESVQYRSRKRDGGYLEMEAYGSSMIFQGRPAVYGTIIDVTERKRMEDQIGQSLKEKEVLLREIHHRVKNNMQVISSLLSVQSQNIKDNEVKGLFKESQNRIRSIALVHELLYRSDNLDQIEYGSYLKKMFVPLFESYSVDQRKVSMSIEAPKVMITIDKAVPCSLIVNELISNSLKHAFPGDRKGAITIRFGLDAAKGEYTLEYADDGVGLPPGLDIRTLNTLGMKLINGLTKQLGGTIEARPGGGARFRIVFPSGSPAGGGS